MAGQIPDTSSPWFLEFWRLHLFIYFYFILFYLISASTNATEIHHAGRRKAQPAGHYTWRVA
jgi:hypothetical protein